MRLLLDSAPPKMIPFIALGAFAGLRAAEMARIDWSAIDLERRLITIRADQAKTASRRLVPISDNLAAWLAPHAKRGRVLPTADMQKKAGALAKVLGIEWPSNGLRHSFITYRIAEIQSADQVALEGGNSPTFCWVRACATISTKSKRICAARGGFPRMLIARNTRQHLPGRREAGH